MNEPTLHVIPVPMLPEEIMSTKEAAHRVQVTERTVRRWCREYGIGRQPKSGATVQVSIVALEMCVCGDDEALELLRTNQREHPTVQFYINRLGLI